MPDWHYDEMTKTITTREILRRFQSCPRFQALTLRPSRQPSEVIFGFLKWLAPKCQIIQKEQSGKVEWKMMVGSPQNPYISYQIVITQIGNKSGHLILALIFGLKLQLSMIFFSRLYFSFFVFSSLFLWYISLL